MGQIINDIDVIQYDKGNQLYAYSLNKNITSTRYISYYLLDLLNEYYNGTSDVSIKNVSNEFKNTYDNMFRSMTKSILNELSSDNLTLTKTNSNHFNCNISHKVYGTRSFNQNDISANSFYSNTFKIPMVKLDSCGHILKIYTRYIQVPAEETSNVSYNATVANKTLSYSNYQSVDTNIELNKFYSLQFKYGTSSYYTINILFDSNNISSLNSKRVLLFKSIYIDLYLEKNNNSYTLNCKKSNNESFVITYIGKFIYKLD